MKIGIIGFGYWGINITRNFLSNPAVESVTVADTNPERLTKAKKTFPSIFTTSSTEELLTSTEIDLIAIVTPVHTHYALARQALENGKHVLVEKPMTDNAAQARELVELAREKNLVLAVDHTFLFTDAVRKIKELVDSNRLGDLWYFDSVRIALGLFQTDVNVIWDLAPHDLAILLHIHQQRPIEVSAVGIAHSGSGLEDIAYLTLHYGNQFMAHIHVNWVAPTKIRQVMIGGSDQMLVWNDLDPAEKLKVYNKGITIENYRAMDTDAVHQTLIKYRSGDMWAPNLDNTEALSLMIKNVIACAQGKEALVSPGTMGVDIVAILEATQKSIKNGGARTSVNYPYAETVSIQKPKALKVVR